MTDQEVNRGGDSRRRGWGVWWVVVSIISSGANMAFYLTSSQ